MICKDDAVEYDEWNDDIWLSSCSDLMTGGVSKSRLPHAGPHGGVGGKGEGGSAKEAVTLARVDFQ